MAFIIDQKELDFHDISSLTTMSVELPFLSKIVDFLNRWYDTTESIEVSTSGSTGPPKTIQLSKVAMRASAKKTAQFFEFKAKETAL